jgi:hypothetical protein
MLADARDMDEEKRGFGLGGATSPKRELASEELIEFLRLEGVMHSASVPRRV